MKRSLAVLACLAAGLSNVCAWAQSPSKSVQVAIRTLQFVIPPASGPTDVAILFDPSAANSRQDAEAAVTIMQRDSQVGQAQLKPVLVPVTELARLDGIQYALLSSGLQTQYAKLFEATSRRSILSIAQEPSCAQQGNCVMAVMAEPKVQILLNREAARRSSIEFATAFRIMVTEL